MDPNSNIPDCIVMLVTSKKCPTFVEAVPLDPNDAMAYVKLGIAYNNLGQYAKADAEKAKACSLDNHFC